MRAGGSAVQAVFSQESHTLPAEFDGTVTSYAGSGTNIRVFEGTSVEHHTKSDIGPVRWMAPEALLQRKYSDKTDAYSFSMLLVEICADGLEPYAEDTNLLNVAKRVAMDFVRPVIPADVPAELADLMRGLWEHKPAARLTMTEARDALDRLVASYEAE